MAGGWRGLGAALLVGAGALAPAVSCAATPGLLVFYVEAPPARAAAVAAALRAYAAKARADAEKDTPMIDVLSESGRAGRMAVVEQWPDLAPEKADRQTQALQAAVGADLQAPIDDRLNDPLVPLDFATAPTGAFHVLMHIDVVPDGAAVAARALAAQRAEVLAAPGALAFEAAAQANRPNHFAVYETWKSRAAYEAYAGSPAAQGLRRQLAPFKGAPFDDRFYGP